MNSKLIKTTDTNYKGGFVHCESYGWHKELGDGFNQYHIDSCPSCNKEINTRIQTLVTTGRPGNYTVKHGSFIYFVIENCIHVQYSAQVYSTEYKSRIPE